MPYDLDAWLEKARKGERLEELAIKLICIKIKEIFVKEKNVKAISTPVTCVGDTHGQFLDLQEIFRVGGEPPYTNFLFLGDYVDRGPSSVELITLLCLLKIKYPDRVTIIRGNHETRAVTQNYGFYMECQTKYGNTLVWELYTDVFDYMPIACKIDDNLFCVHGGLSPSIESVDEIENLYRFQEIPHEGPLADIMWSDPDKDNPGFTLSTRGAGYLFGQEVIDKFLHLNKLKIVIRAHQLCQEGYQLDLDDKLVTVWSAPNYCYRFGNLASVMEIDETGQYSFNIFSDSPENLKQDFGAQRAPSTNLERNYFI